MVQNPETDTIIEEIHESRRKIFEAFGGNIAAILNDARKRQSASSRMIWQRTKPTDVVPSLKSATLSGDSES